MERILLSSCIGILWWGHSLFGQGMYSEFGRSPYRHLDREWFYVEEGLFRVYYHQGAKALAEQVLTMAKSHLIQLQDSFDYHFRAPVSVILFSSYNEWFHSNFPLELTQPVGHGLIPIRVNHLTIFFTGNHYELAEQLRAGLSDVILSDLFFGGTLQERVQNAFLLTIPEWTLNGFKTMYAWEWDAKFDDWMKNAVISHRLRWFNQLEGLDRYRYAMAFWRYLKSKYGVQAIRSLLFMAQVQKNLETALYAVLGKSLGQLHREFFRHYRERVKSAGTSPSEGIASLPRRWRRWEVLASQLAEDGRYAAFLMHRNGRYRLLVADLQRHRWEVIYREGILQDHPYPDAAYFVFAFQPKHRVLWVCYPGHFGYHLAPYHLEQHKWGEDRLLTYIDKPLAFDVDSSGQAMVFSAIRKGQSDIFYYRLRANRFIPVTLDPYDDLHPQFGRIPEEVVFISNRPFDTLWLRYPRQRSPVFWPTFRVVQARVDKKAIAKKRRWHLAHLYRVPYYWETIAPRPLPDGTIVATVDQGAISHFVQLTPDSVYQYSELIVHYNDSNVTTDTFYFFHPDSIRIDTLWLGEREVAAIDTFHIYYDTAQYHRLASAGGYVHGWTLVGNNSLRYVGRRKDRYHVFTELIKQAKTPDTKALNVPAFWQDRQRRISDPLIMNISFTPRQDLLKRLKKSYAPPLPSPPPSPAPFELLSPYPKSISFSVDSLATPSNQEASTSSRFQHSPYELTFLPRHIRLQLDNSLLVSYYYPYIPNQPFYYIPRANALTSIRLQDIFRNDELEVGFRSNFNFLGGDYWLRYINRRKHWVHDVMFYRTSLTNTNQLGYYYQQVTEMVSYRATLPLTPWVFVRLSPSIRHDKFHFLSMDYVSLTAPSLNNYRVGLKGEIVFQDLLPIEFNLYRGYRGKIYYETFWEAVISQGQRISSVPQVHVLGADLRHYLPLRRPIIWAQRLSMGWSLGKKKIVYYLGGEENWFLPQFNTDLSVDAEYEYIYQALVAPLRGFPQNIRNGSRYLLLNNELRVAIFHIIHGKPIRSDFLEKFQLVMFGDIGTAWNRGSPISKEAAIRKHRIQSGPFDITVETTAFPMVGGAGLGLRLEAMGYYWRLDYGWGFELGRNPNRQFYLAVGSDF